MTVPVRFRPASEEEDPLLAAVSAEAGEAPGEDPENIPEEEESAVPREQDEGLSFEEIETLVRREVEEAVDFIEEEIGPVRAEATRRYRGEPYGDEEDGRSRIVDRVIRDTIIQIMPSMMRLFAGAKSAVEFEANRPDAEDLAKQRTDYVNFVFFHDNPGFDTLYRWLKDGFIRGYGVVQWWWDDRKEIFSEEYEGLLEEQVLSLGSEEDVESLSVVEDGEVEIPPEEEQLADSNSLIPASLPPDAALPGQTPSPSVPIPADPALAAGLPAPLPAAPAAPSSATQRTFRVQVRRQRKKGRARFALLPGEEFLIDREATGIADARVVGRRRKVSRSDLIAMGIPPESIDEHLSLGQTSMESSPEPLARNRAVFSPLSATTPNEDLQEILLTEVWTSLDLDGDGIAELRKFTLLGEQYALERMEETPERPFAFWTPDPEAHELIGPGYVDLLEDLQRVNTVITRSSLDSLMQSITPRMGVVENSVNMLDVLNNEVSGVIRMKSPDAVVPITTPFVGAAGIQMLQFFQGKTEERSGMPRTAQGLDADLLQSTTKSAVAAQMSAGQARLELLARVFAETGFKDLFLGLQRLIMRHQDSARTVRFRGRWITADPATWNAELDVRVNVGLGVAPPEDRILRLAAVAQKQETILRELGPSNPLVTFDRYRNTLARMAEDGLDEAPEVFFGDIPAGWQPPQPEPKPTPEEVLAQAQAQEIQARIAIEQGKLEQARLEVLIKDSQERARLAAETFLKIKELEIKHSVDISEQEVTLAIEAARLQAQPAAASPTAPGAPA